MPEIIAVILQKVEVIMKEHGYWKVTGSVLLGILIWQFSNILNATAKLIEVIRLKKNIIGGMHLSHHS